MSDAELMERIALLEAHVVVQEDILVAMQAERIEAERLNDSVTRLGMGASDLGAALLQVDKTQQMLTKLGTDIRNVEAKAASSDEVEEKVRVAKAEAEEKVRVAKQEAQAEARRARLQRNLIILAVMLLALGGAVASYSLNQQQQDDDYENCLRGQRTLAAVNTFLSAVSENSQVPEIKQTATNLINNFRPTTCEEP